MQIYQLVQCRLSSANESVIRVVECEPVAVIEPVKIVTGRGLVGYANAEITEITPRLSGSLDEWGVPISYRTWTLQQLTPDPR